jgi:hypothetical protein
MLLWLLLLLLQQQQLGMPPPQLADGSLPSDPNPWVDRRGRHRNPVC